MNPARGSARLWQTPTVRRTAILIGALVATACGGGEEADPCPRAVIDWEGGPSPYRTDQEAVDGFVSDFPELRRLDGLELADGRISWAEGRIGSYELASLAEGTVAVVEASWCFPGADD